MEASVRLDAELVIEGDPNDPAVAAMMAAVREHATITVTGVKVSFGDGLYQTFWEAMTAGRNIRLVVPATTGSAAGPGEKADLSTAVVRRPEDGHALFPEFEERGALTAFLEALGDENAPVTASGLDHVKKDANVSGKYQVWTEGGAFDLTAFVELAESARAGAFWHDCLDARNVGLKKIQLMRELAVRLRQRGVV
ncbi:MAG TPA: hypothetical protein VGH44_02300 [Candidatus Saccharimonadia bacterium]|jgi:hypothetical protein